MVVGARLAGCAVAAPLARAGRKVVVLDKMSFPSDQLSTHVLLPAGTSELLKMGALTRILALDPSRVRWVSVVAEGITCTERMRPAPDGTDFGVCVPRDLQDICLVEAVREQGGEVRERCTLRSLHWRAGRVAGVRYTDEHGGDHDIATTLVVGADGRRSIGGSFIAKAPSPTSAAGIPSRYQAQRHPSGPPTQVAIAAVRTGLARPAPCAPICIVADMRARMPIG